MQQKVGGIPIVGQEDEAATAVQILGVGVQQALHSIEAGRGLQAINDRVALTSIVAAILLAPRLSQQLHVFGQDTHQAAQARLAKRELLDGGLNLATSIVRTVGNAVVNELARQ